MRLLNSNFINDLNKIFLVFVCVFLQSCFLFNKGGGDPTPDPDTSKVTEFLDMPLSFETDINKLDETSGLANCTTFSNALWAQEDSGNPLGVHLIGKDGTYKVFFSMNGANRDCEDLAIGPGPVANRNYIYLADIGDNNNKHTQYYIHRFFEPVDGQTNISEYETITFTYPQNMSYNSEAMFVDPLTKDIYVITKDQFNVLVFKLPYPQSVTNSSEATYLGTIPLFQVTAADISPKGDEILIRNYFAIYYWKLKAGESIYQAISRPRDVNPSYQREDQGEAICWDKDVKGFYVLGERAEKPYAPKLYYYMKK